MIRNYGLFWKREGVYFGSVGPGNPGSLMGKFNQNNAPRLVNFRNQIGIYCLYDINFSLLYVGKAGDGNSVIWTRLASHTRGDLAERWTCFSWFGLRPIVEADDGHNEYTLGEVEQDDWDTSRLLRALEGVLILGAEPTLNRQGARFLDATKIKQHWDTDNLPPEREEMLRQIWHRLQEE